MRFKSFQRNILITGPPGCGKSTIIEKVVQQMNGPASGFFTKEIREGSRRLGFVIHTLDGKSVTMAHINIHRQLAKGSTILPSRPRAHMKAPTQIGCLPSEPDRKNITTDTAHPA